MSNINLNGYETLIPDAAYGKDTGVSVQNASGKSIGIKEVILPKVYTEATEADVINYLQKRAGKLYNAAKIVLPSGQKREGSILDQALKNLPQRILSDLCNKNDGLEAFIRQNTGAPDTQTTHRYLSIRIGLVPEDLVERIREHEAYEVLFSNENLTRGNLGEALRLKMLLFDDALYKERSEIDTLLKHGTMRSDTLEIDRRYDPQRVMELMNVLYSSLAETDFSKSFPDSTQEVLEKYALQPLIKLHGRLRAAAMAQEQQQSQRPKLI